MVFAFRSVRLSCEPSNSATKRTNALLQTRLLLSCCPGGLARLLVS
ncbi:hypothetical protein LINGRAPRIM_LOCUS1855 [Linum grandiflorum]